MPTWLSPFGRTFRPPILILSPGAFTAARAVRETGPVGAPKPRLLDRVREAIRASHYSHRTEKAYVHWIKRYISFNGKRHPAEMGASEVTSFLTSLAVHDKLAASTQNQALSALLFLYSEVLGVELPWPNDVVRAQRPQHLPVVQTRDEVRTVRQRLDGVSRLMALLLYGAGLRSLECCHLRVKDIDFATNQIVIRAGKGRKARVTMLPAAAPRAISRQGNQGVPCKVAQTRVSTELGRARSSCYTELRSRTSQFKILSVRLVG